MIHGLAMTPQRIQRFEVIGALGSGAMGTVYRAHDPQLEREVAIKVLRQPMPATVAALSPDDTVDLRRGGPAATDELLREARLMARLSHPNVLPVYEVGLVDGAVFVVMEYIAGCDLASWLAGPRPTEHIVAAFAQAARGLAAAHAHGIVHRDFKPANVLVGLDGRVRVADFGLSRLTNPSAQVRIDDGVGTPRYMAPELWRGDAATPSSDVFALCAAMLDALGGDREATEAAQAQAQAQALRRLAVPLRAALTRGVAEDPAARPGLDVLLALLVSKAPRRRWLVAGVAVAVLAAGVGGAAAFAFAPGGDDPAVAAACEVDPALFAGRWDFARHAQLAQKLGAAPAGEVAGALAALDVRQHAIAGQLASGCAAARAGQLAAHEAQARASCLERRAFELGATVDRLLATAPDALGARDRIEAMPEAADCVEITAPALPAARGPVAALYGRWVASFELGTSAADGPAHLAALAAIERDAQQLGERELEARAAYTAGVSQRLDDALVEADRAEQRAYRAALELHATNVAVNTLTERGAIATLRGDSAAAAQLAQLAQDAAARPTTSMRTRARLQIVLGRTAIERGDFKTAITRLEDGLALIARSGRQFPGIEHEMRFDLINALVRVGGRSADSVRVARDTVAMLERQVGEGDPNYGVALNLLAFALGNADQVAEAAAVRRQALAVMVATQPPTSSHIVFQRADIASDLSALGELEAASKEMAEVMKLTEQNQTLAGSRADLLLQLATTTFEVGRFPEAMRIIDEALEATIAKFGKDHQTTLDVRETLIDFEHELGKTALAARHLAALEATGRAQGNALRVALDRGALGSELATERGKPADGERASREVLATLDELHARDSDRAAVYHALGLALIAERRWADARDALDKALALARASQRRADEIAVIEIDLARVEAGTGRAAAAHARAVRARRVLDRFPAQLLARKRAAPLLR
jgi:eukaryotic-like serine/threonine-protein kinase